MGKLIYRKNENVTVIWDRKEDEEDTTIWWKDTESVLTEVGAKAIHIFKHELRHFEGYEAKEKFMYRRLDSEGIDESEWTWIAHDTISRLTSGFKW